MKPWVPWAVGGAAVGALLLMRKKPDSPSGPYVGPGVGASAVHHRERAVGVDARLLDFLDEWEAYGYFPIMVLPDGGNRDNAAQRRLYAKGRTEPGSIVTNASTVESSAHGHRGALDVAPYVDGVVPWKDLALFSLIGQFAKARGLLWGGDWTTLKDYPHIEVPDWRGLPLVA